MSPATRIDPASVPLHPAPETVTGHPDGPGHSYAGPEEIVGRSTSEYVHVVVLLVTACADLVIFYQVLSLVLRALPEWLVWLAVAGFTTCSLLLAHFAGRLIRDARAGHGPSGRGLIWVLVIAWFLLGATACTVRLIVAEQGASSTAASALGDQSQTVVGTVLFLALYVGSGIVSAIGAYLSRNPLRDRFRKAQRDHRAAQKRLQQSQAPYERAVSVLQIHLRNRRREADNYAAARDLRIAYAAEMKSYAEILIAAHLQDPSATTGVTSPRQPNRSNKRADPSS